MSGDDRTVHAVISDQWDTYEVVRYERAGKWYCEARGWQKGEPRRPLSLAEAARMALTGEWRENLPGGQSFDAKVRRLRAVQ